MAALPTSEEKIRMVLDIFKHFDTRPDEVVMQNSIVGICARNGWRISDVADGIDAGKLEGLFEDGPNGSLKLTADGFDRV